MDGRTRESKDGRIIVAGRFYSSGTLGFVNMPSKHTSVVCCCLFLSVANVVSAAVPLYDEFSKHVDPVDSVTDPYHFKHTVHFRSGLGRVTHFQYDGVKHNETIHPHYSKGIRVTACTPTSVDLQVSPDQISQANSWKQGWKFTTTKEHFPCPDSNTTVYYREVVSKQLVATASDGTLTYRLSTKAAVLSDFFQRLTMKMYSSHIVHNDLYSTAPASDTSRRLLSARGKLLRRRLWFKKLGKKVSKWVKKKLIKPVTEMVKFLATGKADKTWTKDFALNWNYDKEMGQAAKTLPIDGKTACTSCYFHADAGYKVEIDIEHYKLESVVAEVYGDVELDLSVTNPGPAVDIHKLDKVMDAQLFSITFMIGPVPIVVSLNMEVDLGYHFTVAETGATPHVTAHGEGHIRFGKQYNKGSGWAPINSHTLDLNFDSDLGTVHADMYLYANVVPTLKIHDIGSVGITVTPAVDVGLTAALPKATCDLKPLQDKHASCVASEGGNEGCSLSLDVKPSINVEMNIEVDVELFKKTIYKKTFDPMSLYQKTFSISGYPKCLISSWSKSNQRRRFLLEKSLKSRRLTGSSTGQSIRDPNLADPRAYLQQRGRHTACPSDCSGQGFCVNGTNGTFHCDCQLSWTGSDCATKLIRVVDRSYYGTKAGISTTSDSAYPEPALCGHNNVLDTSLPGAQGNLKVCKGRTGPAVCASANSSDISRLDLSIGEVLKDYITLGYPCSAAMAELQCRISFPSVIDTTTKRIAPISFESCMTLFTPCLGGQEADIVCTDTAALGGSHAGIALPNSPWKLSALPSLFDAEHAANNGHRRCVPTIPKLTGCPSRKHKMIHINTDIWKNVEEADTFVAQAVQKMKDDGTMSAKCIEANREQLCAVHMGICNEFGNAIKMKFDECTAMVERCPTLPEKTYADYGLQSATDPSYPGLLCSDESEFFVRNFVGKHPVVCGYEKNMAVVIPPKNSGAKSLPWYENVNIVGPAAGIFGMIVGIVASAFFSKRLLSPRKGDSESQSTPLRHNSWALSASIDDHRKLSNVEMVEK